MINLRRRLTWLLMITILSSIGIPPTHSADVPLLTWERGKEQNVILGNTGSPSDWKLKLVGEKFEPLDFRVSSTGPDGSVVYSITLPSNLPLGVYSIQTLDRNSDQPTIVAGVDIVETQTFEVTSIPEAFKYLLIAIVFLFSCLIAARDRRVREVSYRKRESLVADGSLVYSPRFPKPIYNLYRLRLGSLDGIKKSLLRTLIDRDSEFLHSISPVLWSVLPALGLIVGAISGFLSSNDLPNISGFLLGLMALIGLTDSLSGFYAAAGFTITQIVFGSNFTLSFLLILLSMSLSIIFTGLFADFLKIFLKRNSQDQESLRVNPIELLLPALSAAGFFLFSQNLANSFSIEVRKNQEVLLVIAVLLSCVYGAREVLRSTHNQQRYEFQMIRVEIRGVISSSSAFAAWIVFTAMVFSWSQAWLTTFLSSLIFLLTISLTIIRFSQPKISFLSKFPRNIIAEAMISSICAFGIFMLIGNLAFTASQKSTLYVTLALIPCFFHALFVNLYDVPEADSAEGN